MKKLLCLLAVPVIAGGIGLGFTRRAQADAHCRSVNGRLTVSVTSTNCTSPVGLCTQGVMESAGKLNGTSYFTGGAVAPAAGMPGAVPGSTLSYAGTIQLTTSHGTVTFQDTGIFDTAGGRSTSLSTLIGGTGRFSGATGRLFTNAAADASGHLVSAITGEICFADGGDRDDDD